MHALGRLVAKIPAVREIREDRIKTAEVREQLMPSIEASTESASWLDRVSDAHRYRAQQNHISKKVERYFGGHSTSH